MENLSGKTALVTGSTDGVGRLVASKLGQAGARVLVHGRDAERGARVVAEIEASGGTATFLAADLSALAEVRRLAGAAEATLDRLDILIGIGTAGPRQTLSGLDQPIPLCPADETFTIRAGALFLISGNSSNVSRKPAR